MISGVIPCLNAENTLEQTITSLLNQSIPLREVIVIDDGSEDDSVSIAKKLGCRVISFDKSMGRGYARRIGVIEVSTPFILFCDSSNIISSEFTEIALQQFGDVKVSACFGRILNHENLSDSLSEWRGRHLFHQNKMFRKDIHQVDCLITYTALMKKEHVLSVGNFNPTFRQCEDLDMGRRLIENNFKIMSDPQLVSYSLRRETLYSLFSRYHRWRSQNNDENNILFEFILDLKISYLIFLREDITSKRYVLALISLILPFFLFLKRLFSISLRAQN